MPNLALLLLQAEEHGSLRDLLAQPADNPALVAAALATAFFLGAAHALTPGHGKALVATYLAGTRGRVRDAVFLGIVVTLTHTSVVFALGLALLYATTLMAVDRLLPYLSLLSGLLVTGVGLWLLWQRWYGAHGHHHHHHHHHAHPHQHGDAEHQQGETQTTSLGSLAEDNGVERALIDSPDLPGATRGSLVSLGVAAGLVPCPESMVVLLFAVSLGQVGYGLLLLVFFTLGLAAILIAIGCALVLAAPRLGRFTKGSPWMSWLPRISAGVVLVIGILLIAEAVSRL